ncbi:MAG: DoxX family membrane protein [Actinobacteria bacterium]|nr:DoxX family membrane protein [Actinomycetota bacterium]
MTDASSTASRAASAPSAPTAGRVWSGIHLAARAGVGGVYLAAGLSKAFDRQGMILAVDSYDVLPEALVRPVAAALPWVEIALGAFLLLGLFLRASALLTALLTAAFIAGMAQARARGLSIDGGCFGGGGPGEGVTWWDLIRDGAILAGAALLAFRPVGPLRLDALYLSEPEKEVWEP